MEILGVIVILILVILLLVGLSSRSSARAPENRQMFGATNKTAEIARLPDRLFAPRRADSDHFLNPGTAEGFIPKAPVSVFKPKTEMVFSSRGTKMDLDAPCYLTGQPMSSCTCEECKTWRLKYAQS